MDAITLLDTLPFGISYLIMYSVLIFFIIKYKGLIFEKIVVTLLITVLTIISWISIGELFGWPTYDEPPTAYTVIGIGVVEPNKKEKTPGGIYVQLMYDDEKTMYKLFNGRKYEPRMFSYAYSKERHKQAMKVQGMLAKGMKIRALKTSKPGEMGKKGQGRIRYQEDDRDPLFYIMPRPKLPPK